jgi:hypothetical protein
MTPASVTAATRRTIALRRDMLMGSSLNLWVDPLSRAVSSPPPSRDHRQRFATHCFSRLQEWDRRWVATEVLGGKTADRVVGPQCLDGSVDAAEESRSSWKDGTEPVTAPELANDDEPPAGQPRLLHDANGVIEYRVDLILLQRACRLAELGEGLG